MYTDISVHGISNIKLEVRERKASDGKPFKVVEVDVEEWRENTGGAA